MQDNRHRQAKAHMHAVRVAFVMPAISVVETMCQLLVEQVFSPDQAYLVDAYLQLRAVAAMSVLHQASAHAFRRSAQDMQSAMQCAAYALRVDMHDHVSFENVRVESDAMLIEHLVNLPWQHLERFRQAAETHASGYGHTAQMLSQLEDQSSTGGVEHGFPPFVQVLLSHMAKLAQVAQYCQQHKLRFLTLNALQSLQGAVDEVALASFSASRTRAIESGSTVHMRAISNHVAKGQEILEARGPSLSRSRYAIFAVRLFMFTIVVTAALLAAKMLGVLWSVPALMTVMSLGGWVYSHLAPKRIFHMSVLTSLGGQCTAETAMLDQVDAEVIFNDPGLNQQIGQMVLRCANLQYTVQKRIDHQMIQAVQTDSAHASYRAWHMSPQHAPLPEQVQSRDMGGSGGTSSTPAVS